MAFNGESRVLVYVSCWCIVHTHNINLLFHYMQDEIKFWEELQKKYLEPLKENKEQQEKMVNDLRELRNKVSLASLSICKNNFLCGFVYMLWNSKVLDPCCFAVLFHIGYICLFLLQCTLDSGNLLP